MRALCFLIAQLAGQVAGMTDEKGRPLFDWRTDPFFFQAYKLAVAKMLDALQPSGEIVPPRMALEAEKPEMIPSWKCSRRLTKLPKCALMRQYET